MSIMFSPLALPEQKSLSPMFDPRAASGAMTDRQHAELDASGMNSMSRGWRTGRIGSEVNELNAQEMGLRVDGRTQDADLLRYRNKALQEQASIYAPRVSNVEGIRSLGDAGSWVAGQVGQMPASSMNQMLTGTGMNAAANMLGAVKNPIAQLVSGGLRLAAPAEMYRQNQRQLAGEMYGTMANDPTVMANHSAQELSNKANLYGAGAGVLDTAVPAFIAGQLGGGALRQAAKGAVAKPSMGFGKAMLTTNGIEAATETGQEYGKQLMHGALNADRDTKDDASALWNSAAGAFVGGSPMAAAGHLAEHGMKRISPEAGNEALKPGDTHVLGAKTPAVPRGLLTPEEAPMFRADADSNIPANIMAHPDARAREMMTIDWLDKLDADRAGVAERVLTPLAGKDMTAAKALQQLKAGDPTMAIGHVMKLHEEAEDAASLGTQFSVHGSKKNAQNWNSPLPDARTQDGDKPLLNDDDAFDQWHLRMKDMHKQDAANKALPPESFAATDWTPEEKAQAKLMGQIAQQTAEAAQQPRDKDADLIAMSRTDPVAGIAPMMRDLGYEIASMVRSAGLNTDEGPVAPVPKDQNAFDAMQLRIGSIANSLRVGLKEHAQEALDHMSTAASTESKPVFDAIAAQLTSQRTPEGREALRQARYQAQDELLRAIPAADRMKLKAEGIDLESHGKRDTLLQMMEMHSRGQLDSEVRDGLVDILGHNTFNKLARTLNLGAAAREGEDTLLNDAGTDPNAIDDENSEQGTENKQGSMEAHDAERVASAVNEPFYGYARSGSSLDMKNGAFLADTMGKSEREERMQSNRDRAIAGEAQLPTTRHPGLFRMEGGKPVDMVTNTKDPIMNRVIADMETKLKVDRTPDNMMRILKEEGNGAAIDFVKQLQADGSPESQARLDDIQKSFFENRAGGHRVVSKPVMEILDSQNAPDERLLSLHHAYLHQNSELETSQAEKLRNTDPEAHAKAMARVAGHQAQIPKTLAALLDLTDRKGKNGKPAERVTMQERGDAIKAAKKYFTEHHVVVGEELSNRDTSRITPTEILKMADMGDRAVSHLRKSGKNLSDINILTFQSPKTEAGMVNRSISRHPKGAEHKDANGKVYLATKPGEMHIPAGKIVEWAMQRRGETTKSDVEGDRKAAKFDAGTKNSEYLELLMEGIAALGTSGYVSKDFPTKVNAEGKTEGFGRQRQELIDAAKSKELLFRNMEANGAPKDQQDAAYKAWSIAQQTAERDVDAAPPSLMLHNTTYKDHAFGQAKKKGAKGQSEGQYGDAHVLGVARALEQLSPETMTEGERVQHNVLTAKLEEATTSGNSTLEMRAHRALQAFRVALASTPERLNAVRDEVSGELAQTKATSAENERRSDRLRDRLAVLKGELNMARNDVAKKTSEVQRMMDDGVRGQVFVTASKALDAAQAKLARVKKDITTTEGRIKVTHGAAKLHAQEHEANLAEARRDTGLRDGDNEKVDGEQGHEEKLFVPEQRAETPRGEGLKEGEYTRKHWLSQREKMVLDEVLKRRGRAEADARIAKFAAKHTADYLKSPAFLEDPLYTSQSTTEGKDKAKKELAEDFRQWWMRQYQLHGSEGMMAYEKAAKPMYVRAIEARTPRDRKDNKDVPRPGESKSEDRLAGVKDADGVWTPVGKDNIDRSGRTVSTLHVDRSGTTYGDARSSNISVTPLDVSAGQDKRNEADEFSAQTAFSAMTGSDAGMNVKEESKKSAVAMARENAEATLSALDSSIDRGIQMLRARLRMAQTAAYHDAAKLGITKQQAMDMATGGAHYALPAAYILTEERIAEYAESGATNAQLRELGDLRVETARTLLDGESFKMQPPMRIAATRLLQGLSTANLQINQVNVRETLEGIVGDAEPMDLSGGYVPGRDTKAQLKANSDAAMTAYQEQLHENEAALREGRMPTEVLFSALRAPAAPVANVASKTHMTEGKNAAMSSVADGLTKGKGGENTETVTPGRTPLKNAGKLVFPTEKTNGHTIGLKPTDGTTPVGPGKSMTRKAMEKHTELTNELAKEGERVIARLAAKARGEVADEAPQAKSVEVDYKSVTIANESLSSVVDNMTHPQVVWAIQHREQILGKAKRETAFITMIRGEVALLQARLGTLTAQVKAERQAGLTAEQKAKADKVAALDTPAERAKARAEAALLAAKLKGTTYKNASGGTSTFGDKPAPAAAPAAKHHANVPMSYPMGNGDLIGALRGKYPNGTTTKELMANGDRTATTRSYALGAVGETFDVGDGNVYRITGVKKLNLNTPVAQGLWSKLEGWNFNAVQRAHPGQVVTGAIQTTFEKVKTGQSVVAAVRAEAQAPASTGINIYSKSSDPLGKALTNVTYGAYTVDTVPGLNDPGQRRDAEGWYKANKATTGTAEEKLAADRKMMARVIAAKLRQYPELAKQITERGGLEFLRASEHTVGLKNSRWEGKGADSSFLAALAAAYKAVLANPTAPKAEVKAAKPKAEATLRDAITEQQEFIYENSAGYGREKADEIKAWAEKQLERVRAALKAETDSTSDHAGELEDLRDDLKQLIADADENRREEQDSGKTNEQVGNLRVYLPASDGEKIFAASERDRVATERLDWLVNKETLDLKQAERDLQFPLNPDHPWVTRENQEKYRDSKIETMAKAKKARADFVPEVPALRARLAEASGGRKLNAQATSATTPVNDPLVSGPLSPSTDAQVAEAKAWAQKNLLKDIRVMFKDGLGFSGEWLTVPRIINIARDAASGVMGAMRHEGLHAFFTDFIAGNPQAKVMFNAITQNQELRDRVHALLDGHPQAQADMLRDPEEMLAYTFQFWKGGQLELPFGKPKTAFQKVLKFFRQVLGAVSDFERATDVLAALEGGRFAELDVGRAVLAGLMGQGTWSLKARRNLDRITQRLGALTMPTEEIYATSPSAMARKLGHLWFTNPGDEATGDMKEGYLGARKHEANKFVNAITRAMQEFNDLDRVAVAKYMQAETLESKIPYAPHRAAVAEIRATMDIVYKYATKSRGLKMDYAGKHGYYPVVWSTGALEEKKGAFVAMLMQPKYAGELNEIMRATEGIDTPAAAAGEVFSWLMAREGMADKFSVKDGSDGVLAPYFANEEKRKLNWIEAADREPFLNKDLVSTLSKYVNNVVHAAEYTHRFGREGQGLKDIMKQVTTEIYDAADKLMKQGELKDNKARIAWAGRQLRDIEASNGAMEGSLGSDVSSRVRKLNSYIMVYQNFRLLATTLFASFADPMGLVANGATMQQAYKAWLGAMKEVVHDWANMFRAEKKKYPESYFMKLAQMTGAIEHAMISHHVAEENSASFMDRTSKKLNNMLFKANGMEAFDRGMRAGAMEAAYYFLLHHKGLPEKHSARWLKNLGLTPDQILVDDRGHLIVAPGNLLTARNQEWTEENMDRAREEIAVLHKGLNRWVESAILSPSAAARPAWASDPHYASMFHLKQFTYTWHQTIRKHALQEYDHGNLAPMGALAGMVPVLMASNILKGLFIGGGTLPTHMQGMSFANHVENAVQNAGLGGVHQMGLDNVLNPTKLGGPMIEQITGWFLNDKTLGQNAMSAMPLQQLAKGFAGP